MKRAEKYASKEAIQQVKKAKELAEKRPRSHIGHQQQVRELLYGVIAEEVVDDHQLIEDILAFCGEEEKKVEKEKMNLTELEMHSIIADT